MRSTDYISKGTAVARLYKAREYLLMDRDRYYWFPVHQVYNLKRLEILEMEIDNQLKEEGYGEG